ncbi:MAG: glycosyltransferase, partial [Lachnospiraceae bacterium]|nr:glycosyltransferase [Lachnospiraceae bacterium]
MSKIPVTVCIIAKNEENFMEECLKHLLPYGMEIIVADTGSTDRTKEIAAKYADKVVDFEWVNDFAAARNYCASFAANNWILAIDCDEIVQSVDVRILRMLMQKHAKYTGVLRLKNITNDGRGHKGYVNTDVPRMYNKNFYMFDFAIHEQIVPIDPAK